MERFFGVLIEHYAGAFPLWLAPVQVGLVPISSEKHLNYAEHVKAALEAAGLRVELDARNEKMNAKIRDFGLQKVPFILILGDKEAGSEHASACGPAARATRARRRWRILWRGRRRWWRATRWSCRGGRSCQLQELRPIKRGANRGSSLRSE